MIEDNLENGKDSVDRLQLCYKVSIRDIKERSSLHDTIIKKVVVED